MIGRKQLAEIVGDKNVVSGDAALAEYARDPSFVGRIKPDCVVKPGTADDVKKLVNFARENRVPLVPVSYGVPHHVWSDTLHDMYGPHVMNYHRLLRKIKKSFDPNQASEASNYITLKEEQK